MFHVSIRPDLTLHGQRHSLEPKSPEQQDWMVVNLE